jgi:hypothetical protein
MPTVGLHASTRAEEAVRAVLPPSTKLHRPSQKSRADLVIAGVPVEIKWVGEGWLGDVRQLITRDHRPGIVVARRMSKGAQEALRDAGIGWVDETGAAEIAIGSIIVSRTGTEPAHAPKPPQWTPSVLAVAEALLCGTRATVTAVKQATTLSTGSCTNALRTLTDLGLLAAEKGRGRGSARRIVDPDRLLADYASAAIALRKPTSLQLAVTWRDPITGIAELGDLLDHDGIAWAATSAAAAGVLAPHLGSVRTGEIYVAAESLVGLHGIAKLAGLRAIEGGRLMLRPFPTVATRQLSSQVEGLRVAPWPRVYADLRISGVRGEEAAEHLREVMTRE